MHQNVLEARAGPNAPGALPTEAPDDSELDVEAGWHELCRGRQGGSQAAQREAEEAAEGWRGVDSEWGREGGLQGGEGRRQGRTEEEDKEGDMDWEEEEGWYEPLQTQREGGWRRELEGDWVIFVRGKVIKILLTLSRIMYQFE